MSFWIRESKDRRREDRRKLKFRVLMRVEFDSEKNGRWGCQQLLVKVVSFHSQADINLNHRFSIYSLDYLGNVI